MKRTPRQRAIITLSAIALCFEYTGGLFNSLAYRLAGKPYPGEMSNQDLDAAISGTAATWPDYRN